MITSSESESVEPPCTLTRDEMFSLLRPVYDPDIGVSIVDLGLIYDAVNNDGHIKVDMTLTTPSCPYGPQLISEVEYVIKTQPGVKHVEVEIVWDPMWSLEMVSDEVKLDMGIDL